MKVLNACQAMVKYYFLLPVIEKTDLEDAIFMQVSKQIMAGQKLEI